MSAPAAARSASRQGGLAETAVALLRSMRPRQWPKNAVVLVGLVFARELGHPEQVLRAGVATLLFCLLSGSVYLVNDLVDVEKDRRHPLKRHRPLAAGQLAPAVAGAAAAVLGVGGLAAAAALSPALGAV
ncbi:MAG TPA: UbiA family prenyltransferase, partial [Chloroflexota bacterium]|nr:UbiA family prenyltransferase [Chloroflexota bacterium]